MRARCACDKKIMRCDYSNFRSVSEGINLARSRGVSCVRGWRGGINESCMERRGETRGGWGAREPARNIIFRQMCGRGREIIAPARSSWSSVRKCDRIINAADARGRPFARTRSEMIVTEGQSQGRRNLAEDDVLRHEKKNTLSPSRHSVNKTLVSVPRYLLSGNFVC